MAFSVAISMTFRMTSRLFIEIRRFSEQLQPAAQPQAAHNMAHLAAARTALGIEVAIEAVRGLQLRLAEPVDAASADITPKPFSDRIQIYHKYPSSHIVLRSAVSALPLGYVFLPRAGQSGTENFFSAFSRLNYGNH